MIETRSSINPELGHNCAGTVSHYHSLLDVCVVEVCIFVFLIREKRLLNMAEANQEHVE